MIARSFVLAFALLVFLPLAYAAKKKAAAEPAVAPSPSSGPAPTSSASPEPEGVEAPKEGEEKAEKATIISAPDNLASVEKLKFLRDRDVDIELAVKGEEFQAVAHLEGEYLKEEWGLVLNNEPTDLNEGKFKKTIQLNGRATKLKVQAIGPLAEIEEETFVLVVPQWDSFKRNSAKKPPKRLNFMPGLGLTYLAYGQTNHESFAQTALTAKAALTYLLFPPYWDLGMNAYINALPTTTTHPTGATARFIGANLRFGFALPFIDEPWRVSILPGIGYSSMIVSGAKKAFGYKNLVWPQIFPTARRLFKSGHSIFAYGKFASIAENILDPFSSGEYAFGCGWVIPLENKHPLSFTFDFSSINIAFGTASKITANSFSLGAGYGF